MPSIGSGGYVKGTVTNAERMPACPSIRHSGAPDRLAALSTRESERFGFEEKLKMPWPAGLRPVRNDDQAVGVTAGMVERSGPYAPSRRSRASVGRRPSASSRSTSSGSAPSSPSTSTLIAGVRRQAAHRRWPASAAVAWSPPASGRFYRRPRQRPPGSERRLVERGVRIVRRRHALHGCRLRLERVHLVPQRLRLRGPAGGCLVPRQRALLPGG